MLYEAVGEAFPITDLLNEFNIHVLRENFCFNSVYFNVVHFH